MTVHDAFDRNSDRHAEIEEVWVSPTQWKRVITAPNLNHVTVVDTAGRHVESTGDYMPIWIKEFITAIDDPIPAAFRDNQQLHLKQLTSPSGELSNPCASLSLGFSNSPAAPAGICFYNNYLLHEINYPGYVMEFNEFAPFGDKDVPRLFISQAHGLLFIGRINLLERPSKKDTVVAPPGAQAIDPLGSTMVGTDTAKRLAKGSISVDWPPVPSGQTSGNILFYLSLDNTGQVREIQALDSDNPRLVDAARDQLLKMKWAPAGVKGTPIQVTTLLQLPFETKIDPTALSKMPDGSISENEAKVHLMTQVVPKYPPQARAQHVEGSVYLSAQIDEKGAIEKLGVIDSASSLLTDSAMEAVRQWKYKPYLFNGVPQKVSTVITVHYNIVGY